MSNLKVLRIVLAMLSDVYDTYDTQIDKTNFFLKFDTLQPTRKYGT
jgi:hypothetical protein